MAARTRIPAARCVRVLQDNVPPKDRGRREDRVPAAPAASCARVESTRVVTTGSTGATRPSLRNGFAAYTRSHRSPSLIASVAREIVHELAPSVGSASGDQDHAPSPSVSVAFVNGA